MALSKERTSQDAHAGFVQPRCLYEVQHGGGPSLQMLDTSSLEFFCHKAHGKAMLEGSASIESLVSYPVSHLPTFSEPSNSSSSSGFTFGAISSPNKDPQSILSFTAASDHPSFYNVPMLSFEQEPQNAHVKLSHGEDSDSWADAIFPDHQLHQLNLKCGVVPRWKQEMNCFKATCVLGAVVKESHREEEFGWLYPEEKSDDSLQECRVPQGGAHKRPYMDCDVSSSKRQCSTTHRKSKTKAVTAKDTQSIAAKNRRERISERLKTLQTIVPNGTKVDLVTMLEKAISYVKFLQLQVKVLSTDEFWPTQGGKAPEVAQVREAIDAILSSHNERNFGSK